MSKRAIVAIVMFAVLTPAVGVAAGLLAQGRVPSGAVAAGPGVELGAPVVHRGTGAATSTAPDGPARGGAIGGAVTSTAGLPPGSRPAASGTAGTGGLAPGAAQPAPGASPTTVPSPPLSGTGTTAPPPAPTSAARPAARSVVLEVVSLELRVGPGTGDVSATFLGLTESPFAQQVSGSASSPPFAFAPVEVAGGTTTAPLEIDFTRSLPSGRTTAGTATVTVPLPGAGSSRQVDTEVSQVGISVHLRLEVTATSL